MLGSNKLIASGRGFAFALIALALFVSALVPRGYMIAPSSAHLFEITLCPETNPVARAFLANDSAHSGHHAAHHAAHLSAHDSDGEGDESLPSTAQSSGDCAFASLFANSLLYQEHEWEFATGSYTALHTVFARSRLVVRRLRLRPPLRAPPVKF